MPIPGGWKSALYGRRGGLPPQCWPATFNRTRLRFAAMAPRGEVRLCPRAQPKQPTRTHWGNLMCGRASELELGKDIEAARISTP